MKDDLEDLVSGPSGLLRWILAPGVALTAGMVALASSSESSIVGYAVAAIMMLLAIGVWNPVRHRWALRLFAGALSLTCLGYVAHEFLSSSEGTPLLPTRRGEPHPINAILVCLVFGVPSASFALTGKLSGWIRGRIGVDDPTMEGHEQPIFDNTSLEPRRKRTGSTPGDRKHLR